MSKVEFPSRIFQALASVSKWLNSENIPHAIIGAYYPDGDFERIRTVVSEFQILLDRPEYIHKLEELLQRHRQSKSV